MFGNYLLLLLIIFTLTFFNINTIIYIYKRFQENKMYINNNNNNNNNNNFSHYFDINSWLENKQQQNTSNNDNNDDINQCKGMVIEIKPEQDEEKCNEISKDICGGKVILKKITVPLTSKIDFYSHGGYKLEKGRSYCIYKPPPDIEKNISQKCNETWGFWQYSAKYEQWQCKSKIPGIYNATDNKFDPCSKGKGHLFYQNSYLPANEIAKMFTPELFYSLDFQEKFRCECPRGYISRPDISRTTCFKDPCLLSLPPNSLVVGYQKDTQNCQCTPYFTNLFPNNPRSPCTACPIIPSWNRNTNTLTVYVKCGEHARFPCLTEEDKIRGCTKATVKVKPVHKNVPFEELVFF